MGAQAVRLSNVDIDNALKNKDFEVLFQPVFDLGNGALARVETFVRWRHPKLGLLPPGAFISFFETQGRMSELTRYVLGSALKAYMDWRGPWPPGLSVNLALSDLSDDAFTTHFTKLLRDHDFPADLVTLECPMPPVDMPIEVAKAHFERLGETGARLAIEVRGRANELLRSLEPFPFDEIKTGGSAILRFARTVRGPGLSAIADLLDVANEANAAITAVGVEDQASLAALRGLGFTAAQGNHLGKVGDLKDFRPHRINEVRALLDLEPLSAANITAMFRTEAPAVTSAPEVSTEAPTSENEDALIDRLNERVAQFDNPAPAAQSAPATQEVAATDGKAENSEEEEEKKNKAREKAKALALAKRAKARAERKNAAIERAKAKASGKPTGDITDVAQEDVSAAPREMQERISREFNAEQTHAAETAVTPNAIPPQQIPAPKQTAQPQVAQSQVAQQAAPLVAERAVAQQAPMQAKVAGGGMHSISMEVGASRAYFQPGIRVGAAALVDDPGTPVKPRPLDLPSVQPSMAAGPKPPTPPQPPESAAKPAPQSTVERAMQAAAKPVATAQPAAPKPTPDAVPSPKAPTETQAAEIAAPKAEPKTEPATVDVVQGDLNDETATTAEEANPVRKSKPFLKRTVVPLSSHFWPRSWRRSWKRRAAARAANDDQQSPTEETAQTAE